MKLASLTVEYWKDPKLCGKFGFLVTIAALIITIVGLLFLSEQQYWFKQASSTSWCHIIHALLIPFLCMFLLTLKTCLLIAEQNSLE